MSRLRLRARNSSAGGTESSTPPGDLLLQTILEVGPRAEEGKVVFAVALPWFEIDAAIEKDPSFLNFFAQNPRRFEEFLIHPR
jgi:hypothetical protein